MPLGGKWIAAPGAAKDAAPHADTKPARRRAGLASALFAAALIAFAAPSPARAIDRDSCAAEVDEFVEATNYTFGEDYAKDMLAELLSTGPINMEFIDSFGAGELGDLTENAKAYRSTPQSPESDPDMARVKRAERAAMNCFFDRKIAELRSGTRSGTLARAGNGRGGDAGEEGSGDADDSSARGALAAGAADDGYIYDDTDNGNCVSVETRAPGGSGSEMAYGHFVLANKCAYPVVILRCFAFNRADGTPAPDFDRFAEGQKCPGIGWLGGGLKAGERQDGREWYEYTQIKWEMKVCREGWDFIGKDGRYPQGILGEPYRCRTRRQD